MKEGKVRLGGLRPDPVTKKPEVNFLVGNQHKMSWIKIEPLCELPECTEPGITPNQKQSKPVLIIRDGYPIIAVLVANRYWIDQAGTKYSVKFASHWCEIVLPDRIEDE